MTRLLAVTTGRAIVHPLDEILGHPRTVSRQPPEQPGVSVLPHMVHLPTDAVRLPAQPRVQLYGTHEVAVAALEACMSVSLDLLG